eukprot:m.231086 g.231086  ORF g.231086 m.231086 type:complete len:849 (-) comp18241_c0_seq1:93-2639(-)
MMAERPEIGPPEDFEHFQHVGVGDLETGMLDRDSNSLFFEVAERRRKKLPRTPKRENTSDARAPQPIPLPSSTPRRKDKDWYRSAITCLLRDDAAELAEVVSGHDLTTRDTDMHTLLDIALMVQAPTCVLSLRTAGCPERDDYTDPAVRADRLTRIRKLRDSAEDPKAETVSLFSMLYDRWNSAFISAALPPSLTSVRLTPAAINAIQVTITAPANTHKCFISHFRIEWSYAESFANATIVFVPSHQPIHVLENLRPGVLCYVRASSVSLRAIGPALPSTPPALAPTSWRESADGAVRSRHPVRVADERITHLETSVRQKKFSFVNDEKGAGPANLFGSSIKYQKTLKKGVYFAVVVYSESDDGVCVAAKNTLPLVAVDESIPADLATHFQWFQRVAADWRQIRSLRAPTPEGASALIFRRHLLDAAAALQASLDREDLGILHHEPVRDGPALVLVLLLAAPRTRVPGLSWASLSDLANPPEAADGSPTRVLAALPSLVQLARGMRTKLEPGLHLMLLTAESTISDLFVRIRRGTALPPCAKIRARAHVSRPEWEFLTGLGQGARGPAGAAADLVTNILAAVPGLLGQAQLPADDASVAAYRLYDVEVVELDRDVALLLLLPPAAGFLANAAGSLADTPEHIYVPATTLEMALWSVYQPTMVRTYSRLSAGLGNEILTLTHAARVALSAAEGAAAKENLAAANTFVESLSDVWTPVQWLRAALRWGRTAVGAPHMELLRQSLRAPVHHPAPAAQPGPTATTGTISIALDLQSKAHRGTVCLTAAKMAMASDLITLVLSKFRISDSADKYNLILSEGGGVERALASDSHVMLLKDRWPSHFTLILRSVN